jgi:alpha-beta hydrolase superfamily lysophospholipase
MTRRTIETQLELLQVSRAPEPGGAEYLRLRTDAGDLDGRLHDAPGGDAAILWVFGAGGGLDGPAGGLYRRLARQLVARGVASLELAYRRPGNLPSCLLDVFLAIAYLGRLGRRRIVLVGHSFGGAVVITAGATDPAVIAVAALSSQTYGTDLADRLSPRPLFLAHGTADDVLPPTCSQVIYRRAGEPKRLVLYPGCRHGLDECRDALDGDLLAWLHEVLALAPPGAAGDPAGQTADEST